MVEVGYFIGAVLKVGIHCDDHVALGMGETHVEGGRFAVVAAELHSAIAGILGVQLLDDLPRGVLAAVVHHYHFIVEMVFLHHAVYPFCQMRQRFVFVEERYDD